MKLIYTYSSDNWALLRLALSSKPISKVRALKFIHSIKAMRAPIEPKNLLNWAKLFTKYENPNEAMMVNIVANVDPALIKRQPVFLKGAR